MKLTLYMSHLCPHCVDAVKLLDAAKVSYTKKDITADLEALKEFLDLREALTNRASLFRQVLEDGKIGVPCFVFSDGYKCLLPEDALQKLGQ